MNKAINLVKYYILSSNIVYLMIYSKEGLHQFLTFMFVSIIFINQFNVNANGNEVENENRCEECNPFQTMIFYGEEFCENIIDYKFNLNTNYFLSVTIDGSDTYLFLLCFYKEDNKTKLTYKSLFQTLNKVNICIYNIDNTIKISPEIDCILDVKITNIL